MNENPTATTDNVAPVTPIQEGNRRQRRAAAAKNAQFLRRVKSHSCLLNQDCLKEGVQVHIEHDTTFHKLHTARGEPVCPACPVCEVFRAKRRPPTKFNAREREALLFTWRKMLADAKREQEQSEQPEAPISPPGEAGATMPAEPQEGGTDDTGNAEHSGDRRAGGAEPIRGGD